MSYSKRQLYALGEPLGDSVTVKKVNGGRIYGGGGGGSPAPAAASPTQTTVQNTNIPEYAQPYVENMLNAAQAQIYTPDMTGFNPYTPYSNNPSNYVAGFSPMQQQAQSGVANMQVPGQYGAASNVVGTSALGALGTTQQAGMYGGMGARAGQQGSMLSNMYGNAGAQAGQQASDLSNMYGGFGALQGQQGANIGQSLGELATNPAAQQAYMNPYLQASLNPQLAEIQRQYDITGTQEKGAATRAGAFGGNREALMAAENQRNKNTAMNQAIGQGYNTAFNNAQQQMLASNQAALAGNQQALTGYGMGLQGAGQAGAQTMQGLGMGLTGAQQAANLGMQGAQAGLAGVGAQQAGYNAAGQQATNLANIGGQELQAQQGIYNLQNQYGAQQQAQQQNIINQAVQNYATAQQYPYLQLGMLNSMLRGLPMQQASTQMYQAAPNQISQLAGLGTAGLGAAAMYNAAKGAKGGSAKDIAKYAPGGAIPMKSYNDQQLQQVQKSNYSEPLDKLYAASLQMDHGHLRSNPEAAKLISEQGLPPPQMASAGLGNAPTGDVIPQKFASGGIMSFADEGEVPASKNPVDDALAIYADKSGKVDLNKAALALLGQAQSGKDATKDERAAIEKSLKEQNDMGGARALTRFGLNLAAQPGQYLIQNVGQAGLNTLNTYEKEQTAERELKRQLAKLDAEGAAKDDARRLQLAGTLLQIQSQRDMKMAALANAPSGEDRAINRAQTLVNNDPTIKALTKQQAASGSQPGTPEYDYYEQRIAERQMQIFHTAGVKVPEVTPTKIQYPKQEEKPGFFSGLFGGGKSEPTKSPSLMKFDSQGNPV